MVHATLRWLKLIRRLSSFLGGTVLERAMPLVEQVRQRLLRGIRDDSLVATNGSLPSEAEISERLAVSRATVRDALEQLERDQVIIRRHGSGTYINPTVRDL